MFMATSLQICEGGLLERRLKVLQKSRVQSKCAHKAYVRGKIVFSVFLLFE
jgi:hypothetical protein